VAGGIAALAGLSAAHRRRRLRSQGRMAWATVMPPPDPDQEGDGFAPRVQVQFALDDGRVIERQGSRARGKRGAPHPGEKVLVWYDQADLDDVLVLGHDSRRSDHAFSAVGLLLVIIGCGIASLH
jgi:hypothetical protein